MAFTYYVVMRDFGRRGREAIVDPELTRANIVDLIRSKNYTDILFIHAISEEADPTGPWITYLHVIDVTHEIMKDAGLADV